MSGWRKHEARWIASVDAAMAAAADDWGRRWPCRAGRSDCCQGPFPINALDVLRLRVGLAELWRADPARATEVVRRARAEVEALRDSFPGDPETGRLALDREEGDDGGHGPADGDDARGHDRGATSRAFFERHADRPCPALDPATGRCEVYAHRPLTCRTYGPPLELAGEALPGCPFCFGPADEDEQDRRRVRPDPDAMEDALLDRAEREEGLSGETLVAHALTIKT